MRERSRYLLMLLAGSPMILVAIGATGPGLALQPTGQAASPADANAILEDRSPGARRGGTVQSKPARTVGPTERVLSSVRERPASAPAVTTPTLSRSTLGDIPLAGTALALGPMTMGLPEGPLDEGGFIGGGGGSTAVFVPVTTPGSGGGGGDTPGTPGPPTTPAVPEPLTWVTLLGGLGLLSWRLRHDRRGARVRGPGCMPG